MVILDLLARGAFVVYKVKVLPTELGSTTTYEGEIGAPGTGKEQAKKVDNRLYNAYEPPPPHGNGSVEIFVPFTKKEFVDALAWRMSVGRLGLVSSRIYRENMRRQESKQIVQNFNFKSVNVESRAADLRE